jgi:pyruvate dehydrogenase E1 component alpha subunit
MTSTVDGQLPGVALPKSELLEMYRLMVLIRRFEEVAAEQYALGKIAGFLHLYIGEEAVAVGAIRAMDPDDHLVTHYRDHGYALALGLDPRRCMAELFGKATGLVGGRGGSMHFADASKHFWGGYAIVAGLLPIAAGLGLASKYLNQRRVAVAIFGDGATNNGAFHEALNFAALWKLPVLFLCENNQYGMGTAVQYASAVREMYRKACAYDIPAERVDGQNVLAVYEAMKRALEHCRSGNGPYFLEALTYRYRGHSMADPGDVSVQGRGRRVATSPGSDRALPATVARPQCRHPGGTGSARPGSGGGGRRGCPLRRREPRTGPGDTHPVRVCRPDHRALKRNGDNNGTRDHLPRCATRGAARGDVPRRARLPHG